MLPSTLDVLVRGWLHGNVVRLPGALIDTGYHAGVDAVLAGNAALERIVLTHVHSDHAGGVAALVEQTGAEVHAHADARALVDPWNTHGLWIGDTGQELPRFRIDHTLGETVEAGGITWTVIDTPGHAVGGVSLLDPAEGVLITGDALWEDGFGMLHVWRDPPGVFERTELALSRLDEVDARVVIPGHGAPFTDLRGALARAWSRLRHLASRPDRHRAQVIRNSLAFLRMAHPNWSDAEVVAHMRAAATMLTPLPGDEGPSSEALVEQLLTRAGLA